MNKKIKYFAYGSNMCLSHMRQRVPKAEPLGRAQLIGWSLSCNKRSKDGSGKANLVEAPRGTVWGVLYEIEASNLPTLDKAEGGYQRLTLDVLSEQGGRVAAEVYVSSDLTDEPVAYEWYKELIIEGAREHGLPEDYLETLERLPSKPQPVKP